MLQAQFVESVLGLGIRTCDVLVIHPE